MTLDEMIQLTADYASEEISKDVNGYQGEELVKANRVINALNYAYLKICREKYKLEYHEQMYPGAVFTKTLFKVNKILDQEGNDIPFTVEAGQVLYNYDYPVDIYYYYIPDKLVNLTDVPELPDENVDHTGLCFYATFQYLMAQGRDYYNWLDLWNDFFENIKQGKGPVRKKVVNVYD